MGLREPLANFQPESRCLRTFDMPQAVLRSDVPELEVLVPALTPVLLTHRQRLAQHGPASGERADSGVTGQLDSEAWVLTEIRLRSAAVGRHLGRERLCGMH